MDFDEGFHEFPEDLPFWYGTASGVQFMPSDTTQDLPKTPIEISTDDTPSLTCSNQDSVMQFFVPNTENENVLEAYVSKLVKGTLGIGFEQRRTSNQNWKCIF